MTEQISSKDANCDKLNIVLKGYGAVQTSVNLNKLKQQCHYKQRMNKVKMRRDRLIRQELGGVDVTHLRPDLVDEIGAKLEKLEKEKKKLRKKKVESDLLTISKLLDEQKKRQKIKIDRRKKVIANAQEDSAETVFAEEGSSEEILGEFYEEAKEQDFERNSEVDKIDLESEESQNDEATLQALEEEGEGEENISLGEKNLVAEDATAKLETKHEVSLEDGEEEVPKRQLGDLTGSLAIDVDEAKRLIQKKKKEGSILLERERSIVADPPKIIFSNFRKNKIYVQEFKMKNVGTDCLRCRYLWAEYEEENNEDPNPVKVMTSSCLLRPGLSVKAKITLHTTSSKDLKGKLIFETKRNNPEVGKRFFFVPISCTVPKAIITVTPVKINFPAVPWCCATGPKNLRKIIQIKNTGARKCTVRILKENSENERDIVEAEGEMEEEEEKRKVCDRLETEIMDELISNVFETFRFNKKYHIEVEPFSTKNIQVTFSPKYRGFHCETVTFVCQSCKGETEQKVELTGDIEKIPIRSEPSVLDFKTCVMDSGVYQGTFKIFNDSRRTFPVAAKVPSCLKNHCDVFPSEPIIQPYGFCIFSVRFYPRSTLPKDVQQYYCKETQLLEFPIFIHQCILHSCKPDYLKVFAFALITNYALELEPSHISFGTLSTLETIKKEIYLTNHSIAIQEYGFLNLPKGVRIEPNFGFGRIFPKETITLFIFFSPIVDHIDDDKLGLQTNHHHFSFNVKVISVAELGGFGRTISTEEESIWSEERFEGETNTDITDFTSLPESNSNQRKNKNKVLKNVKDLSQDSEHESLSLKIQEKEQAIKEYLKMDEMSELSFFDRVMKKCDDSFEFPKKEETKEVAEFFVTSPKYGINRNVITCESYIIDPYCELSSTVIQLPATPCSSFSLTKFYLNGTNLSTASTCYCGWTDKLQEKDNSNFKFWFEFHYNCPDIKIEPRSGCLEYGKKVPITIVFQPEFPVAQLRHETKMQKSIKIFEEMNKVKEAAELISTNLPKGKKDKKDKKQKISLEVQKYENPDEILNSPLCVLRKNDFFHGEKILQLTMSPFFKEIRISCVVKSEKGVESHEMLIVAPIVKPDFIFLGDSQEISFGKIPIGTSSKIVVQIQNVVMERIKASLSILNPFGPFTCPIGSVELDPEHVWNIPVAFSPLEEKGITIEFVEICSGKTIFPLKISGEGIDPKYSFDPDFVVGRIEAKPKGFSEFKFDFQNLCEANLPLNFAKEFTKEGITLSKRRSSDKQKKKISKTETEMTEEIISQLENEYEDLMEEGGDGIFTITGFEKELIVPSFASINIKIRFQPPGEVDKNYVSKFRITLGRYKLLKEFLIFGTVTEGK